MKKAMITGSRGFVGQYLQAELEAQGYDVIGFDRAFGHDLRDFEGVRNFIDIERPDYIFHLAAQAFVGESFHNPNRTFEVNTIGSLNIMEAVRQLGLKTKIHLAGTSEEYGAGSVDEESMLEPASPYAVSKAAMDHLGQLYATAYGMPIVITRAFNHTGAGRGEMYAESAWAKQIVEIEQGRRHTLEHGNLETIRNYTDVKDIVKGYVLAVDLPSGVYNICSDTSVRMSEVLTIMTSFSDKEIPTKVNPDLYRPFDFSFQKPNCDKFKELTGWSPQIPLHETLKSLIDQWRGEYGE